MKRAIKYHLNNLPMNLGKIILSAWHQFPTADIRNHLQNLEDPAKRDAFLNSELYNYFKNKEMSHWAYYNQIDQNIKEEHHKGAPCRFSYYSEHPMIQLELHRRADPIKHNLWERLKDLCPNRNKALVLGAGNGNHCRMLIDLNIAKAVTAYDISESLVNRARGEFNRLQYQIAYITADLNFPKIDLLDFDLCLAMHSLHHIINLEGLMKEVARSICSQDGFFVCEDYFGPNFIELKQRESKIIQGIFSKIPKRLRKSKNSNNEYINHLYIPDKWEIQSHSPFEAIRSEELLKIISNDFNIISYNIIGCGLLMTLLNPIIHNFDINDQEANEVLKWLIHEDYELTLKGKIPNFFSSLIAKPKQK